eukprot:CAMPEP_0182461954 /NCGR_PEP_ID=MMETSP1319-20130603/6382_1 /TAXON_ID=172717 /ORGANISM="Bolidomonas pacifica, Strain RCC208" /LENGTH=282 /DNA_ID=CAMNT_0024661317 /DNA_START=119 /DNA_END=964 /DNA_ORIENTATION=+
MAATLPSYVYDLTSSKRASVDVAPGVSNDDVSAHNLSVLRSLKANDAHVKEGQFVCEGLENNRVMLESGVLVRRLVCKPATYELLQGSIAKYATSCTLNSSDNNNSFRVVLLTASQLTALCGFPITRGVISYGDIPSRPCLTPANPPAQCVIALQKISDTANLGGIIRTAANLGFDVVLSEDSCSPWYRKCIRVSMGEVFRNNVDRVPDFSKWITDIKSTHDVLATSLQEGCVDLSSLKPPKRPFVIVFGNEGDGLSQDVVDLAHEKVRIESVGQVDSFNVG